MNPPCVLHEDEHLLVVNKPAGWNTHAPAPHAGEGIYDWLRHREPRWASLAIIHRLDKETSGVLVFGKTPLANKSLTEQFEQRKVAKRYLLWSDRTPPQAELVVRGNIVREGDHYVSLPSGTDGEPAETHFKCGMRNVARGTWEVTAEPHTGRTHQIRVHAAANGFPILGDELYGGSPAARVFLHAAEITFRHPATGEPVTYCAPVDFTADARLALRRAVGLSPVGRDSVEPHLERSEASGASISGGPARSETLASLAPPAAVSRARQSLALPGEVETTAFRLVHGAADGWPGWQVEQLGEFLLSQSEAALSGAQTDQLAAWLNQFGLRGAYHKRLDRHVRQTNTPQASPQLVLGEAASERFAVNENGLQFELSFTEGYSYGLFLDQRDNRRRLLTRQVAGGFELGDVVRGAWCVKKIETPPDTLTHHAPRTTLLNCFAYTCGFSVAAAQGGMHTTSLDLSKKYLEWGRRNFALNGLDAGAHDFIYGDVFDWLRRLTKKGRQFDAVLLDPPTFSQSKDSGVFRAEKDYGRLVVLALALVKPGGVLFASTNCATFSPEEFLATIEDAVQPTRRQVLQQHYVPQPPDFPITRDEPAHLKTVWLRVS